MKTITEVMGQDHDRLDGLFNAFRSLKHREFGRARGFFSEFKRGLQRHIVWEEELLFPLFESQTGMLDRGPTAVMRMEHRLIKDYLEELHERLLNGAVTTDDCEQGLLSLLTAHNTKEELVLYPWMDENVSEQEVQEILARMKALPTERYSHDLREVPR